MFVKISKYLQETPVLESLFNKVVKRRIYDGDRTIFRPCMDNTIDSKVRFHMYFFANNKFLLCFLKDTFCYCFLYPMNLIVAYPFNENNPQLVVYPMNENNPELVVTFKNWGNVRKLLSGCLIFLPILSLSP